ncbi:cathepsin L-like proteinase [Diabrotica undecimpunctata]|uniref:cathepsin L-like proteinase n=1 Tax=Diabrotica undecimpunctata TaxID=50387 RepID=UPI003B63B6E2
MKRIFIILILSVAAANCVYQEWEKFKTTFFKVYQTPEEENQRFEIFKKNVELVKEHNARYEKHETSFSMELTRFSDKSYEELTRRFDEFNIDNFDVLESTTSRTSIPYYCNNETKNIYTNRQFENFESDDDIPDSVDLRLKGYVLPPRDMGELDEHWAFSISSAMEIETAWHNLTTEYLSAQFLIDCTKNYQQAYNQIYYYGIPSEIDYPFKNGKSECKPVCKGRCLNDNYLSYEFLIQRTIALLGPVTIYFDGGDLPFYKQGIIDGSNCPRSFIPDPLTWRKPWSAVIIGYGNDGFNGSGTDYWILRNSWGDSWGEEGYFRLIRGKEACGMMRLPIWPSLQEPNGICN